MLPDFLQTYLQVITWINWGACLDIFFFNLEVKKGHLLSFNIGFNIIHSNFFGAESSGRTAWFTSLGHVGNKNWTWVIHMVLSAGGLNMPWILYTHLLGGKRVWFSTESQKCFWFPHKGYKNYHLELYEFLDMPQQARGLGVMRNHQVSVTFLLTVQPTITPWWSLDQRLLYTTYSR